MGLKSRKIAIFAKKCAIFANDKRYYLFIMKPKVLTYKRRKALLILFTGMLPLCANGQLNDTLHVSFRPSKSVYDAHYKDNGMHVDCFVEAVKQQAQHIPPKQIQLTVYTGATPDGSYRRNHRLGEQRGISIKQVLDERLYGIVDDIRLVNRGPRWGELTATIVAVYRPVDIEHRDTIVVRDTVYNIVQMVNQPVAVTAAVDHQESPGQPTVTVKPADHRTLWAVKTNILLWGLLAPNVEIEVPLGTTNRWSIEGELFCPWWTWNRNTYATQALNIGAELRYWLGNRDTHSTLSGWHLGLALAVGYYDIEWKRSDGWQGEHLNTYIDIGYQCRFGSHWAVDGGLGIGLLATKYRHYAGSSTYPPGHEEQHDDHLIWKEDGHLNLLAATHANISIAYLFDVQSLIPKRWRKKP